MVTRHCLFLVWLAAISSALSGCGGRPAPVGVSGTVTLDGKPLPAGNIQFDPIAGVQAQRRDAAIENGKFTLPPREGLVPGMEFKVSIKAFKKTGRKYPNPYPTTSFDEEIQYIPEKYNVLTSLSAKISGNESDNQLSFNLESR